MVDKPPAARGAPADRAVDRLVDLLEDLGFAPDRRPTDAGRRIGLHHCPFIDLVQTQGAFVCHAHLGLMQGAMAELGASVTVDQLEPFAEPDLCVARLSPSSASSPG